jgi:hypothetical protein
MAALVPEPARASIPARLSGSGFAAGHQAGSCVRADQLGSDRPLLQHEFKIHGRELFLEFASQHGDTILVNASRAGQISLDEEIWPANLDRLFTGLDYSDNLAERWWLADRSRPVYVDPRIHAGYPTTSKERRPD